MKLSYCIFALFLFPAWSFAQTRGKVEIIKDPLIDTFIARRPLILRNNPAVADESSSYSSYGFRVQIFFGSNRQSAYSAQERFRQDYPDYRTYISYTEPNFKVHVGDFRTRLEAQKMMSQLNRAFPAMFIISEKINPPTAKTDAPND